MSQMHTLYVHTTCTHCVQTLVVTSLYHKFLLSSLSEQACWCGIDIDIEKQNHTRPAHWPRSRTGFRYYGHWQLLIPNWNCWCRWGPNSRWGKYIFSSNIFLPNVFALILPCLGNWLTITLPLLLPQYQNLNIFLIPRNSLFFFPFSPWTFFSPYFSPTSFIFFFILFSLFFFLHLYLALILLPFNPCSFHHM